jgi:hypothetical protein
METRLSEDRDTGTIWSIADSLPSPKEGQPERRTRASNVVLLSFFVREAVNEGATPVRSELP